ncbi:MAG TPA: DUF4783 domain-containing protein [Ignavibacteriaceae bacterium]|nr:DUF4783 domain-containing protein [Ignavibacteriaceae bacterium]
MIKDLIIYNLFFLLILLGSASAQEKNFLNKFDSSKNVAVKQNIFNNIESAISSGNVSALSGYLASQTYLSLSNGIRGYYSSNQAYYVLEDFFNIYNVTSFRFDNLNSKDDTPYATGVYNYDYKGKRNSSQVYISLNKMGKSWKITQITIN